MWLGALIGWIFRGCKTDYRNEINLELGWFENIPILCEIENLIIALIAVSLMIAITGHIIK